MPCPDRKTHGQAPSTTLSPAEPGGAGDGLQRPLRSRFQPRLTPSVRGAADKAAHLGGCKSLYRQLPDSDG
jgi:hypothetical protein